MFFHIFFNVICVAKHLLWWMGITNICAPIHRVDISVLSVINDFNIWRFCLIMKCYTVRHCNSSVMCMGVPKNIQWRNHLSITGLHMKVSGLNVLSVNLRQQLRKIYANTKRGHMILVSRPSVRSFFSGLIKDRNTKQSAKNVKKLRPQASVWLKSAFLLSVFSDILFMLWQQTILYYRFIVFI